MPRQHDVDFHFGRASQGRLEVVQLEPQQDAVAVWPVPGVADGAMIVLDLEGVELQYELAAARQTLVLGILP